MSLYVCKKHGIGETMVGIGTIAEMRAKPCVLCEIERLGMEIEVLRLYGNKDCTAMADAEIARRKEKST